MNEMAHAMSPIENIDERSEFKFKKQTTFGKQIKGKIPDSELIQDKARKSIRASAELTLSDLNPLRKSGSIKNNLAIKFEQT